jgi:Flp pilus assembly protein CpaB
MQRLSPGTLILGIFAVLFGLVAAYAAKNYLKEKEVQAAEDQTIPVPMAVTDLPAERFVTKDDIMVMRLTPQQLDSLNVPGPFLDKSYEIIGRQLKEPVAQGQVFAINTIYSRGTGPTVADRLAPGERAVTIPFTGSIASSGLIIPGAMVDIVFRTLPNQGQGLEETTVTLLDRVRVLAVGRETVEGAVNSPAASGTVTLAVTSLQARALHVVQGRGSLSLVLRNASDMVATGPPQPTTLPELLGVKTSKPFATEIWRRGQRSTTIHGNGPPQYIHDAPYGMPVLPVAGQGPDVSDQGSVPPSHPTPLAANRTIWAPQAAAGSGHATGTAPGTTDRAATDGKF